MKFDQRKNELSKHFISLKDGEEIIGVFQGEPHIHHNHWDNSSKRSTLCSQTEDCKLCATGDKKKFRFRLNMITKTDQGLQAKVLEGGWKLYGVLGSLNADFPLEKNYIKIKRTGKTMNDTVYTALPTSKPLSEESAKAVAAIELLPLDPADPFWSPAQGATGEGNEEQVPF